MRFLQLERRLGRGDVDDDQLIELVVVAEFAQVLLDAFDGGTGGVSLRYVRPVGELTDGRSSVQDRAGPNVFGPGVEIGQTRFDQIAVEDVGARLEFADRVAEMRTPDVVAA